MQQSDFDTNRRNKKRVKKIFGPMVEMTVRENGHVSLKQARIVDYHDRGFGFLCHEAISPGSIVDFEDEQQQMHHATVTWCQKTRGGEYRLGVCLEVNPGGDTGERVSDSSDITVDYYELLQLNPKADLETIQRVYRLQAQRFHPDNKETGDAARFQLMHEAYTVLSDAESRAGYDVRLNTIQKHRWKIFEKPAQAQGVEAEKRKRAGILALLYARRMQTQGASTISIGEFENLLGIPKEHLEFALWYLRESACVVRTDDAKFTITVRGVDTVERTPEALEAPRGAQADRLLA